jgi:hypothetical protein
VVEEEVLAPVGERLRDALSFIQEPVQRLDLAA